MRKLPDSKIRRAVLDSPTYGATRQDSLTELERGNKVAVKKNLTRTYYKPKLVAGSYFSKKP